MQHRSYSRWNRQSSVVSDAGADSRRDRFYLGGFLPDLAELGYDELPAD
jgi:hypothetical protein